MSRLARLGVDADLLVVAGDNVGGNMAAVVALMAKMQQGPKIAAQLLFYPVTDASMSTASYAEFAEGPWLTKAGMAWFWDQCLPDVAKRSDVRASPLNASVEQLAGLPWTLLIVDENDVLRDEGEAYGSKLAQAGVEVTSLRLNGTVHDFMPNSIVGTPAARGGHRPIDRIPAQGLRLSMRPPAAKPARGRMPCPATRETGC